MNLTIRYHKNQKKIFKHPARFKVIAKGRRFGLTRGFANYVILKMLDKPINVLWVDTIYSNIERYVERYFIPTLNSLEKIYWKWRSVKNDLKIADSVCDFRSADRPENMEGFGYHLIILNEAGIILKNRKLWEESISPMILDHKAEVLIGGTPKGKKVRNEKHLFYELYTKAIENGELRIENELIGKKLEARGNWKAFRFTTYDNPIIDKEEIDELAKQLPPVLRNQEINGEFIDYENESIIKRSWWLFFNESLIKEKRNLGIYQSWDTAFKTNEENDFSVCTTWMVSDDGYYLLDLFRERMEFPELKRKVVELYEKHSAKEVLIEDHASGQSLIQELKRNTRIPIKPIRKDKDKLSYVNAVTPLIEAGKVMLLKDPPKGWRTSARSEMLDVILNECEEFPNGEHDDIVDSISQFLNYVKNLRTEIHPEVISVRVKRKKFY